MCLDRLVSVASGSHCCMILEFRVLALARCHAAWKLAHSQGPSFLEVSSPYLPSGESLGQRHVVVHFPNSHHCAHSSRPQHTARHSTTRNTHLFTSHHHPPRLIIGILLGLLRVPAFPPPSASTSASQNTSATASSKCPVSTALSLDPAASSSVC